MPLLDYAHHASLQLGFQHLIILGESLFQLFLSDQLGLAVGLRE
jgi:hypothetical protein